ncbi:hypothetical protein NDU88_000483, partial [Pleurodeles waltl]
PGVGLHPPGSLSTYRASQLSSTSRCAGRWQLFRGSKVDAFLKTNSHLSPIRSGVPRKEKIPEMLPKSKRTQAISAPVETSMTKDTHALGEIPHTLL